MRKKKLQVFVSSTFTDLIEERQAAVQAILSCGHIPAGMELFTAGDESQMEVINQWIEDSDVYLLILGGRYGSIEEKSGKSYTHLEYDYAVSLEKPLFAVVITEDALDNKVNQVDKSVLELDNPQKLKDFRGVVLSKMVKFFDDIKDIKLAIHETMSKFERRELVGWIRGDQEEVDMGNLAEQMAQLTKENMSLREQLASSNTETYNGLSFEEAINMLKKEPLNINGMNKTDLEYLRKHNEGESVNLLHYFALKSDFLSRSQCLASDNNITSLVGLGFARHIGGISYQLTEAGRKFYLKLRAKNIIKLANK